MASGDILAPFGAVAADPPGSSYGTFDRVNNHSVVDLATGESVFFSGFMPANYAGSGVTADIYWTATSGTANDVKWELAWERNNAGATIDADSFASAQTVTTTKTGTAPTVVKSTITFTDGAQIDSVAAGDPFRLKLSRTAPAGTDMTGDAELNYLVIKET